MRREEVGMLVWVCANLVRDWRDFSQMLQETCISSWMPLGACESFIWTDACFWLARTQLVRLSMVLHKCSSVIWLDLAMLVTVGWATTRSSCHTLGRPQHIALSLIRHNFANTEIFDWMSFNVCGFCLTGPHMNDAHQLNYWTWPSKDKSLIRPNCTGAVQWLDKAQQLFSLLGCDKSTRDNNKTEKSGLSEMGQMLISSWTRLTHSCRWLDLHTTMQILVLSAAAFDATNTWQWVDERYCMLFSNRRREADGQGHAVRVRRFI